MKKLLPLLLVLCLLLCACSKELEPWEMPQVDAAPTAAPTAAPSFNAGSGPEKYVWNEALSFNIASPGVAGERVQQELSHSKGKACCRRPSLPRAAANIRPAPCRSPSTRCWWTVKGR